MFEIGRLCIKIAGRDSGRKCIVIDVLDHNLVMIDGQTRRRKCNMVHLEPLAEIMKISKGAAHNEVVNVFKELKIELKETKPKKTEPRPKKSHKKKEKPEKKAKKKTEKKAEEKKVKEKEMPKEAKEPKAEKKEEPEAQPKVEKEPKEAPITEKPEKE